jgi:ArsR family transcriptional regulator, arsenate/arsenite/antimonite-responsive transcriptional repressor
MPAPAETIIDISVIPRFEIFYALQSLEGTSDHLQNWRREMHRRLTPKARASLGRIAPSPLIWPLLADSLRDVQPSAGFTEMLAEMREMKPRAFQGAVLSGVFKTPGSVENLLSKKRTLAATIAAESPAQERLLTLLGLLPFSTRSKSALAFGRLVNDASGYRDEVLSVVMTFWGSGFAETWGTLEPQMRDRAKNLRQSVTLQGDEEFARTASLPIAISTDTVRGLRGSTSVARSNVSGIHIIPSAFNAANLWAAYEDDAGRTRFFIPLLDATMSPDTRMSINPAVVFNALGDTTRYAIASAIAKRAMTSVELARMFSVSKPTISHHVHQLRSAGLLEETHTENGIVLTLNRRVLERSSGAAAREMFSEDDPSRSVRRTRSPNKS